MHGALKISRRCARTPEKEQLGGYEADTVPSISVLMTLSVLAIAFLAHAATTATTSRGERRKSGAPPLDVKQSSHSLVLRRI